MKAIYCDECRKFLFTTEIESYGAVGAFAESKGFIYKLPVLFTDKYTRLFFCSEGCYKKFYAENIPRNKEVTNTLNSIKKDIPRMAKECSAHLANLQDKIKELTKS